MTRLFQDPLTRLPCDFAFNLFHNPSRRAIYCAVPEHYPVPRFLEGWAFERSLRSSDDLPPGFHLRAAAVGVRCNGFYLFQITAEPPRRKTLVAAQTVEEPSARRSFTAPQTCINDNRIGLAEVG